MKNMKIAITGISTTGKTTISKKLARELGFRHIEINELAKELKAYDGYDRKRQCKILDMKKLEKEINKIKENIILDGHVSHLFKVDLVIILRCDPKKLKRKLNRKYSNKFKIQQNLEAEILGVITSEALERNNNIYEIDITRKTIKQVVDDIKKILEGKTKNYKIGNIDWLEKYEKWIKL
ncbi:MAG: adenylate kinase family protein [Candidatus Aenigmarchaeota archaeon]|nr:adenylate kinase family protein [Candidatus Aenigmarchaeota archaeon]